MSSFLDTIITLTAVGLAFIGVVLVLLIVVFAIEYIVDKIYAQGNRKQ